MGNVKKEKLKPFNLSSMKKFKDKYHGESWGKKLARMIMWHEFSCIDLKFKDRKFMVLASREGGDIGCLLGLGVDPDNIIAVDRCETAINSCKIKYPQVRYFLGDVANAAHRFRDNHYVYLDFCCTVGKEILDIVNRVRKRQNNLLALCLCIERARENNNDRVRSDALNLLGKIKSEIGNGGVYFDISRAAAVLKYLQSVSSENVYITRAINYHSKTCNSVGSPMSIMTLFWDQDNLVFNGKNQYQVMREIFKTFDFSLTTDAQAKDYAISMATGIDDKNGYLLLNLSPGEYRAFKANHTRLKYYNKGFTGKELNKLMTIRKKRSDTKKLLENSFKNKHKLFNGFAALTNDAYKTVTGN